MFYSARLLTLFEEKYVYFTFVLIVLLKIINKMDFRYKFIIFIVVMSMFNITEFECSKSSIRKKLGNKHKTPVTPVTMSTVDFGVSAVVDNASDLFRKLITKMVAKKRLVGLESGWYW